MPDVSIFNLGGQDITVKDATARSNAQSANTAATEAAATANEALQKVKEVEKLSRVTVEYTHATETITITTATHTK
jgi:hypothetical protein|nr:MAG TPA: hypothetical protein [Caudoviricetes sp.]